MILKIQLCLVLIVAWINESSCASVSKVYVQSGAEALPLEYYQYGTPGMAYASPQIAQLSAAPVSSVVPMSSSYVSPCVAPCVYPGQTISSFAPSSANLISYESSAPSLPTVISNRNEPTGYQYAYVIYDQNTGDPDGYVREVQYTADDLRGFNAIVKNYLPVTEEMTKVDTTGESKPATPCPEAKNEPIKHVESISETQTSSEGKHVLSNELEPESNYKHPQESHGEGSKNGKEKLLYEEYYKNMLAASHKNILPKEKSLTKEVPTNTKEGHETKISTEQKSTETLDDATVLVPYKDIMKCIESLLSKATMVQTESPLAYIVLNKPC